MLVANPSAQKQFLPPSMPELFEELVVVPNREVREHLDSKDADMFLHNCGFLCPEFVRALGYGVHPAVLSLGSSEKLWEAAANVPKDVVLYGNVPSRLFAHSTEFTEESVREWMSKVAREMKAIDHPWIGGTECDVLSCPGCDGRITNMLAAIMTA